MEKMRIVGGKRLEGTVKVAGSKNAAVAIIPAALLSDGVCTIENLPLIDDVFVMRDILRALGAKVALTDDGVMTVDPSGFAAHVAPYDMVRRMRASYYLVGVMLGRFGKAEVAFPGGCDIGSRPIDQHIKGFAALGAEVEVERGIIFAKTGPTGLRGSVAYLDVPSVGATINLMLAAVRTPGVTTLVNPAKEPHVVDLANFLNLMGANIKGAGTDTIRITGVDRLKGCSYAIVPDMIEAGTLMIAAAGTRGDVMVEGVIPTHMEALSAKLIETGASITEYDEGIRVRMEHRPRPANIKTQAYPGFPTDLQQPMCVLLSVASGMSMVTETIYEARFRYIDELNRMGADITARDRVAVVGGVEKLYGGPVTATDLRAGAALVVAGLIADGTTEITGVKYIDRGYAHLERKLVSLGADIVRVRDEAEEE
ncbi:MAG: UDP-N-acetylglucosamine 1-carboxyvinyltransferase [Christensenellales bacterium]|jgi:UDP-N-acetylglucosamine 1-carboxyvinyltransferase